MKKIIITTLFIACVMAVLTSITVPQSKMVEIDSLAGTTWSGTDSDGDHYVFTFEQDGTLAYKSPSGSYRNGKWHRFNKAIYFEMNDHYSDYLGEINGDEMKGKAWNVDERKWTWKVKKDK